MSLITQGWRSRHTITIDKTKVSVSDKTDFPVLLSGANFLADCYDRANANGSDLRFTTDTAGNNQLAFELVSWTPASSLSEVWVKIPTLSTSVDTVIYVWYNNPSATALPASHTYGSQNAWNSNYKVVYHMDGAAYTDINDSTANANDIDTQDGTPSFNQTGKIGKAVAFGGNSDIYKTSYSQVSGNITMAMWVNETATAGTQGIVSIGRGTAGGASMYTNGAASTPWSINTAYGSDTGTNATGWRYLVGIHDGTNAKVYENGVLKDTDAGAVPATSAACDLILGALSAASLYLNGALDEVHVMTAAMDVNWILTEYNNQNSPSTFATASAATSVSALVNKLKFYRRTRFPGSVTGV